MKSTNKENPALTLENNCNNQGVNSEMFNSSNSNSTSFVAQMQQKPEHSCTTDENGSEQEILPNGHKSLSQPEEENDVFEVKMRKNRRSRNNEDDEIRNKRRNSSFLENNHTSSSFLNSRTYSCSTLSLNKSSIFPTGTGSRKKNSISMSLSRGGGSDGEDNVKITGYLEKRSKLLGWKKFWFVLDGRLLAYYKSKSDYDSLSVCCGSINLGIASTIRPIQIRGCKGFPLQIVTRSQVYYLRSPDKQILEQWLLAIQEASSSQPSKISLPVFSDPGSQFFRYSFAASSQWSLNTSTEDITESLSKLPPNFYLKGAGRGPIQSLNNNLKKCHSFASLQTPSLYSTSTSTMSSTYKDKLNNNSPLKKKKSVSSSMLDTEDIPTPKMSSVLKYSPESSSSEVVALQEELVRKLSVGKTGETETVKPSLTKPKAKSDLPFLINPTHGEPHYYDEIVDFEAIYENCESVSDVSGAVRNSASSGSTNDDQGQQTCGDSSNHEQNGGQSQSQVVVHPDNGLYESVDSVEELNTAGINTNDNNLTKEVKNQQNSEIRKSSGSSRKSDQSTKSECNNKSKSKDFSGCEWERSQSLSISNPNNLNKSAGDISSGQKQHSEAELCRKISIDSESSGITDSKESISDGKPAKRKSKKPFGSFFHKMFHRDKGKKSKDKMSPTGNQSLIITGPIDLRGLHSDSPINRETNLPVDEARKHSLTKNQSSNNGSKTGANHSNVMDELKVKVERSHHALPLTSVADHILSKVSRQDDEEQGDDQTGDNSQITKKNTIIHRSNTFTGSGGRPVVPKKPKHLTELNGSTQTGTVPTTPSPTTTPNEEDDPDTVVHRRKNSQSEDFQKKLAKFNRLSERLSSTFEAALNPTPTYYPTVGAIGRSRSFKLKKGQVGESLPPLPPKMKNSCVEKNCYDYPANNRPVPPIKKVKGGSTKKKQSNEDPTLPICEKTFTQSDHEKVEEPMSEPQSLFNFVRSLQKKNSAPDILFSSPRSSSGDSGRNSKEEVDNVFEELQSSPPPIPPKVKPNSDLGSPSVPQKNIIGSTLMGPDYLVPPSSQPVVKVAEFETASILKGKSSPTKEIQSVQPKINITPSKPQSLVVHTYQNSSHAENDTNPSIPSKASPDQKLATRDKSPTQDKRKSADGSISNSTPLPVAKGGVEAVKNETPTPVGLKNVYQNLKFATVSTLVQEYETVEETEAEIAEMYDDFPSEYSGGSHTYESISPLPQEVDSEQRSTKEVRHSGMDELQLFLKSEVNKSNPDSLLSSGDEGQYSVPEGDSRNDNPHHYDNEDDNVFITKPLPPAPTSSSIRPGAVSRLGHSSAIDQLKRMVNYANKSEDL